MKFLKFSILALLLIVGWTMLALYLAFEGAWQSPVVDRHDHQAFYDWAVAELKESNSGSAVLVLLKNGKAADEFFMGPSNSIDKDTLFATASFSKFIAAIGMLKLVEDGELD